MAASGSVLELRNSRVRAVALQLEAAVRCVAACVQEAEGPGLGELLILIREAGVDPLEAAFATGVRRFDRSGEYAADGALSEHRADAAGALAEANRAYQRRYLHVGDPQDGVGRLVGLLDAEGGATVRTALAGLMKPIKDDDRSYGQRGADALVELCRQRSGSKGDGSGPRPQLIISASLDTLAGIPGAPAGELEGGGTVAAETVQRYACDSALVRMTGRTELEHELSHASRTLSSATRRALEARDRRCVWPGCGRPSVWCDGHHLVWWTKGGATALPNLALLCRPHHRMAHEGGWSIQRQKNEWVVNSTRKAPVKLAARRE